MVGVFHLSFNRFFYFQVEEKAETYTPPRYPKIEDFGSAEELHNLSSKDLKILLRLNRVDFKGCVERSELLERAERLWEDTAEQRKGKPKVFSLV